MDIVAAKNVSAMESAKHWVQLIGILLYQLVQGVNAR